MDGQNKLTTYAIRCTSHNTYELVKINTLYRHSKTLPQCTVCKSEGDGAVCDSLQFIVQNVPFSFVDSDKCRLNKQGSSHICWNQNLNKRLNVTEEDAFLVPF